jgi:hypothetical protein
MNATWMALSLLFGSTGCDKRRNERLHHLHRVPFEDGHHEPDFEASLAERGLTPEALKDSIQ